MAIDDLDRDWDDLEKAWKRFRAWMEVVEQKGLNDAWWALLIIGLVAILIKQHWTNFPDTDAILLLTLVVLAIYAKDTRRIATHAQQQLEMGLRARIVLASLKPEYRYPPTIVSGTIIDAGVPIGGDFVFVNVGSTPAGDVRAYKEVLELDAALVPPEELGPNYWASEPQYLGPGETHLEAFPWPGSSDREASPLITHWRTTITYVDEFGKHHETRVCARPYGSTVARCYHVGATKAT